MCAMALRPAESSENSARKRAPGTDRAARFDVALMSASPRDTRQEIVRPGAARLTASMFANRQPHTCLVGILTSDIQLGAFEVPSLLAQSWLSGHASIWALDDMGSVAVRPVRGEVRECGRFLQS